MEEYLLRRSQTLCRHIGASLQEVWELSEQIGEALDRNDQVTVRMLLNMRAEPVEKAKMDDQELRRFLASVENERDRRELQSMLNQNSSSGIPKQGLARQASHNAYLLHRIMELDQRLNQRVAGAKSVYQK
jgi:hypothetical protein